MKFLRLSGIELALGESEEQLIAKVASSLEIEHSEVKSLEVIKKTIDARRNKPPHMVYVVKISVPTEITLPAELKNGIKMQEVADKQVMPNLTAISPLPLPVVVVGSGPAGLFASYVLAQRNVPVIMLERGTALEKRVNDVQKFWEQGILSCSSNVLFGEGGAGTFSDGKLTSRSKNPYSAWIKKIFVDMGAPEEILTDAKPHIGTDSLRQVVINLRNRLCTMGCKIRFEAQVTDFIIKQQRLAAIVVNEREEIKVEQLILAIGQSADDTYEQLSAHGVKMEAKPFAMGLRVEHPQELINSIQYGKWSRHPQLPPAEYFITAAIKKLNRSVYTFCMCPGGSVIGCSAFPGYVLTNGMSNCRRNGEFANSAVVVNVHVNDFAVDGQPLAGLGFRRHWEKQAYILGGSNYHAPAQGLTDFLENKKAATVGRTSFLPGVTACSLREVLPEFAADALKLGMQELNRKMPGFITNDAHLIGIETRTSSPLRICRKIDGQSETVNGLYPCGEGSGYAGGIISSALDGIKAAEQLLRNLS